MKHWMKIIAVMLLCASMMTLFAACDRTHVGKEVKDICKQSLVYVDDYLRGDADIMVTYTSLVAVLTYWDGLKIETTKYTVTKDFQAKMMFKNIIESVANQASGKDARADILRQRNALAEIAGLKELKVK